MSIEWFIFGFLSALWLLGFALMFGTVWQLWHGDVPPWLAGGDG